MSPTTTLSAAGKTVTARTSCATATVAVPETPPALAVIVAVPLPTAVTSPNASTVATEPALLDQITAVPAITRPL